MKDPFIPGETMTKCQPDPVRPTDVFVGICCLFGTLYILGAMTFAFLKSLIS